MQAFLGLEAGTAVVTLRSYVYVYAISGVSLNFGTLAGVKKGQFPPENADTTRLRPARLFQQEHCQPRLQ